MKRNQGFSKNQSLSYEERRKEIFRNQRARKIHEQRMHLALSLMVAVICFVGVFFIFSASSKAESKDQKYKYYTSISVEYGDSLWTIADEYMDKEFYDHFSYIQEVKSINHIHDENEIVAGKMLIVPYYSSKFVSD